MGDYKRSGTILELGDQSLINYALANRTMIKLHRDWYTNYRPNSNAEFRKWRIIHWAGCKKPWGGIDSFNGGEQAAPMINDMWSIACDAVKRNITSRFECPPLA